MPGRLSDRGGVALLITLMVVFLLSAMALALALTASIETAIAAGHRRSVEALLAADAGLERAVSDLSLMTDWDAILSGTARSPLADGPPSGPRVRPDGSVLDLTVRTSLANCNQPTSCTEADLDAVTADRPWGPNNPRWQPFLYGPLSSWLPRGAPSSLFYVVAWVADDPSETDGDPSRDGGAASADDGRAGAEGRGIVLVRVEAFGPSGSHRSVEATVARMPADAGTAAGLSPVRIVTWREL